MTDDIDTELDKLREEDSTGNRLDREDPQAQAGLVNALEAALEAVEQGEQSETITAYDPRLAGVLQALDEEDQLETVFTQLQAAYDGESGLDQPSRSAIIRLAVRVGLQEGTTDILDDLEQAVKNRETTTV